MTCDERQIVNKSAIWDLHIHTCKCLKASSDFHKLTVIDYVDTLVKIFENHPDLEMISFTDHNNISKEVYDEFESRKTGIKLIPGVELDTYLYREDIGDESKYKHLIFYFNDRTFVWDKIDELNKIINIAPIYIYDILDYLITEMKETSFVISPHFMKQDNRAIDYDWTDPNTTEKNIDKYMDQLFCFWEASNVKNIERAVRFLSDYDRDERVSIISFSDSNNPKKLMNYLDNPKQYFNALPTFEGIRMVGSDVRRISRTQMTISNEDKGKYIGSVKQGKNEIYFSNRLNTIIGGRGSGKSLLIDGIANEFKAVGKLDSKRKKFVKNLNYTVFNMKGESIKTNFKVDYFDQGYIAKVFQDELDIINTEYFQDEFENLNLPSKDQIKANIIEDLNFKKSRNSAINENLVAITDKVKILPREDFEFEFKNTQNTDLLDYTSVSTFDEALSKPSIIPSELLANENIIKAKKVFMEAVYKEISNYNIKAINDSFTFVFNDKYSQALDAIDADRKAKTQTIIGIRNSLSNNCKSYIDRVNIINRIISLNKNYSKENKIEKTGAKGNRFIFKKEIKVQNTLVYLHKIFKEYMDTNKIKRFNNLDKNDINNLPILIEFYCFKLPDVIMESKKENSLDKELFNLTSLDIQEVSSIQYYKAEEKKISIIIYKSFLLVLKQIC